MGENINADKTLSWYSPDGQQLFVRQLHLDELLSVYALNEQHLRAEVAQIAASRDVLAHNADAFWGVYQKDDAGGSAAELVGYLAFLMLNAEGAQALGQGILNRLHPQLEYLAETGVRPSLIYVWAVVARKLGAMAVPLATHAMGSLFAGLSLCGTAATEAGLRGMLSYGFKPLHEGKASVGDMFVLDRSGFRQPEGDRPQMLDARFKVVVAHTALEMEQAFAIRAAVFMAEQNCPFDEEFDGNDRTATHIVGYMDGEPAATLRIRYFAGFVKIERLAVLQRFRGSLIAKHVIEAGINFARKKGYRRMYGHAQKRLLSFWGRFGFKPIEGVAPFVFSDHEYIEVAGDLPAHSDPLTMASGPIVFLRTEGEWDVPGVLEASATRPATNPH